MVKPGNARRRPRVLLGVVLVLVVAPLMGGLFVQQQLVDRLHRIDDPFARLHDRPRPSADGAVDFLVLTTDRASTPALQGGEAAPSWLTGARHVDSAFVLHLAGDRRTAAVVGLPDTAWRGSLSAPSSLVRAVETATGVRMAHLAAFDWAGFHRLADISDGIRILGPPGRSTVTGSQALDYVNQPAAGTTLQQQREMAFLRELMFDTLHTSMRHDPPLLYRKLAIVTRHLSVESGWNRWAMAALVGSLRDLRSAQIGYVPVADEALWQALRADDATPWLAKHPEQALALDFSG